MCKFKTKVIFCDFTFWNGSYSQRDSNLEIVNSSSEPAASVNRVAEVSDVNGPHSHTNNADDLQIAAHRKKDGRVVTLHFPQRNIKISTAKGFYLWQLFPKLVQFLLQRGSFRVGGGHLIPDFPDLCLHPSCHGNPDGPTRRDVCTLYGKTRM